jgi:hypothetical protein
MKPVRVSVDVPQDRDDVYAFLDVLANHESFTDHMLVDWECSGPDRGVGSKARVHTKIGGRKDPVDIEVVAATPPSTIVERNVSAGGRRVGTGTYTLDPPPGGGTRITFEYAWRQAPLADRIGAPVIRTVLRHGNARAMQRLAGELAARS